MNTVKRVAAQATKRPSTAGTDRDIALAMNSFGRNERYAKSVAGKRAKLRSTTAYIAFDASGFSRKQAVVNSNTKKAVGTTNLDGDKLNAGRDLQISAARILYSTDGATLQTADFQNEDRLPAELQNAEVVIAQAGNKVLSMPLTDLFGHKFSDFREITDRPVLVANEPFTIEIEMPVGVTVPLSTATINQYCRFEFRVIESKS